MLTRRKFVASAATPIALMPPALRESKLDQNTITIFASGHGEGMCAHRWAQKAAFYEETVRVPIISDSQSLTSLTEILPTLCDFASIAPPKDSRGTSLRPILGGRPLNRKFADSELRYTDEAREDRMLRSARHKYVVFNSGMHPEQLFDLTADQGQTLNLATAKASQKLLRQHRDLRRGWIAQTNNDFVIPIKENS